MYTQVIVIILYNRSLL